MALQKSNVIHYKMREVGQHNGGEHSKIPVSEEKEMLASWLQPLLCGVNVSLLLTSSVPTGESLFHCWAPVLHPVNPTTSKPKGGVECLRQKAKWEWVNKVKRKKS